MSSSNNDQVPKPLPPRPPRPLSAEEQHLLYVRHRRKMNKRKLRAEQKRRTESLEEDVAALLQDTNQLEHHLFEVTCIISPLELPKTSSSMESLIRHYFGLFSNGWDPTKHEQLELMLRTILNPDVIFMDYIGIEKVIEQWRRCCMFHGSFQMQLLELVPIQLRYMRAQIHVSFELNEQSLAAFYPQVFNHPSLPQRLLGVRLQLPVTCHIAMDKHFKISRLDVAVDYPTAFLNVLNNLDDAVEVLVSTQPTGELIFIDTQPQQQL